MINMDFRQVEIVLSIVNVKHTLVMYNNHVELNIKSIYKTCMNFCDFNFNIH